jgi:hypothetical protein
MTMMILRISMEDAWLLRAGYAGVDVAVRSAWPG